MVSKIYFSDLKSTMVFWIAVIFIQTIKYVPEIKPK